MLDCKEKYTIQSYKKSALADPENCCNEKFTIVSRKKCALADAELLNCKEKVTSGSCMKSSSSDTSSCKTNPINYRTVFEGELSNVEDILKCTLIEFKSVIEDDLYLKHFKDSSKESIDDFLI
jgi:hypothetical protein